MFDQFDDWLREMASGGAIVFPLRQIDRAEPWYDSFAFEEDLTADALSCDIRTQPGASVLVSPTVTIGSYADGETPITLSLASGATALGSVTDSDADGLVHLYWRLWHTPSGGAKNCIAAGTVAVADL